MHPVFHLSDPFVDSAFGLRRRATARISAGKGSLRIGMSIASATVLRRAPSPSVSIHGGSARCIGQVAYSLLASWPILLHSVLPAPSQARGSDLRIGQMAGEPWLCVSTRAARARRPTLTFTDRMLSKTRRDRLGWLCRFSASCLSRVEPFCVLVGQNPAGWEYSAGTALSVTRLWYRTSAQSGDRLAVTPSPFPCGK
jgi:hypothetical protein